MSKVKNPASELAKKRWEKVGKEKRSEAMKKVRGGFDFSDVKLRLKPQEVKKSKLTEMANQTDEGVECAILLALSDRKARTKREIREMVEKIAITSACELNRRDGGMEVSPDFDWFTNWSVKMTEKGKETAIKIVQDAAKKGGKR